MKLQSLSRPISLPAAALVAALAITGCSGATEDDSTTVSGAPAERPTTTATADSDGPTASPTADEPEEQAGPLLEVVIAGEKVSPNAQEIALGVGEPLTVTVDSNRAGELHVHSKPEQYVEFNQGASEHELVIKTPGEVEVEDHETGAVVALIEVR